MVSEKIYPVYILRRVAEEIFLQCKKDEPSETLGRLIGYHYEWQDQKYCKIVDWATGTLDQGPTHARFTNSGIRECEIYLDEKYGKGSSRPIEVGVFHSHPFGVEPHFSAVDDNTFLNFPYNREGNVFILIDSVASFFKVYIIQNNALEQVSWICYAPKV